MFSLKIATLSLLVAAVFAEDATTKATPQIVTESSHVGPTGYNFAFKTSDGVNRDEEAHLITVGDHQGIGIKGSYSYIGTDGEEYIVTFTADEKGYRPEIQTKPKPSQ